jgi:hypothetical protein
VGLLGLLLGFAFGLGDGQGGALVHPIPHQCRLFERLRKGAEGGVTAQGLGGGAVAGIYARGGGWPRGGGV